MYTNDRDAYRQSFFITWQKHLKGAVLTPVESQMVDIIQQHPEYHALLASNHTCQHQEFAPEENPFLHMSLHMAIADQLQLNQPVGITALYQQLLTQQHNTHDTQHQFMQCLASTLWQAQQAGVPPDENHYWEKLQALVAF